MQTLTVPQIAKRLGYPVWAVRSIVDSLDDDLPRIARYRLVPANLVPMIESRLKMTRITPVAEAVAR
jgi:hypothetical protein